MYDHLHQRCIIDNDKNKEKEIKHDVDNENDENSYENDNNDEYENVNKNKKMNFSGILLESNRNRKIDLSNKILPNAFHDICNEYRRSKDLKSMVEFIAKYGPKILTSPIRN